MSLCSTNKGSILIEALAAVAIVGVSLALIMESFAGNFRATVLDQEYTKALVLLENRLDRAFQQNIKEVAAADEPCPAPLDRFHYHAKLESLDSPDAGNLKRLEVTVSWPSGKKDRELSVVTYIKAPDVKQETKSVFYN
jgi:type II secretory pathway pseudopilin PulG